MKRPNYTADYEAMLSIFFLIVQGSVDEFKSFEPWKSYAHSLAKKLFRHLVTVKSLSEIRCDEPPNSLPNYYVDHSSALVVTRASFETFLVFNFLFGRNDNDLSKFRCDAWRLGGLVDRQKLKASTESNLRKIQEEKREIAEIEESLKSSPFIISEYRPKDSAQILKGKWTKIHKWPDLAIAAGIDKTYFDNVYNHMSGHSHSSYISAIQVAQAQSLDDQSDQAHVCLGIGLFIMAHFIATFALISPSARLYLDENHEGAKILRRWRITAAEWKKIYNPNVDVNTKDITYLDGRLRWTHSRP